VNESEALRWDGSLGSGKVGVWDIALSNINETLQVLQGDPKIEAIFWFLASLNQFAWLTLTEINKTGFLIY